MPRLSVLAIALFVMYLGVVMPAHSSDIPETRCNFFPYQECITASVLEVRQIGSHDLITVKISEVLRGDYKPGTQIQLGTWKDDVKNLIGRGRNSGKFIIAFDRMSPNRGADEFKNGIVPIENSYFLIYSKDEWKALKKLSNNSAKSPDEVRKSFQCYLETRWSIERIKDFCRPNTRLIRQISIALSENDQLVNWTGELHPKRHDLKNLDIKWRAIEYGGVPQFYVINIEQPTGHLVWQLEFNSPNFENWDKQGYLRYRVSEELRIAATALFLLNPKDKEREFPSRLFATRSDEKLILNSRGIAGYSCILGNNTRLFAKLDSKLNLVNVLVNGKPSRVWNVALLNCANNIDRLNKQELDDDHGK